MACQFRYSTLERVKGQCFYYFCKEKISQSLGSQKMYIKKKISVFSFAFVLSSERLTSSAVCRQSSYLLYFRCKQLRTWKYHLTYIPMGIKDTQKCSGTCVLTVQKKKKNGHTKIIIPAYSIGRARSLVNLQHCPAKQEHASERRIMHSGYFKNKN